MKQSVKSEITTFAALIDVIFSKRSWYSFTRMRMGLRSSRGQCRRRRVCLLFVVAFHVNDQREGLSESVSRARKKEGNNKTNAEMRHHLLEEGGRMPEKHYNARPAERAIGR